MSIALISSKEEVCERSQKCADATIKTEQLALDMKNNQTDKAEWEIGSIRSTLARNNKSTCNQELYQILEMPYLDSFSRIKEWLLIERVSSFV